MDCVFSWLYRGRMTNLWSPEDDYCYDIIGNLPLEISTHILRQLDARSLAAATIVNRKWHRIIRSDRVLRRRLRESKKSYWKKIAQTGFIEPAELPAHLRANFAKFAPAAATAQPAPTHQIFEPVVFRPQPIVADLSLRRRNVAGPVKSALKATAKRINKMLGSRPARLRC